MDKDRRIRALERNVIMWEERFWFLFGIFIALITIKAGEVLGHWITVIIS